MIIPSQESSQSNFLQFCFSYEKYYFLSRHPWRKIDLLIDDSSSLLKAHISPLLNKNTFRFELPNNCSRGSITVISTATSVTILKGWSVSLTDAKSAILEHVQALQTVHDPRQNKFHIMNPFGSLILCAPYGLICRYSKNQGKSNKQLEQDGFQKNQINIFDCQV